MKKFIRLLFLFGIILLNIILITSCKKKKHEHKFENCVCECGLVEHEIVDGLCKCGEIKPEQDLELISFDVVENEIQKKDKQIDKENVDVKVNSNNNIMHLKTKVKNEIQKIDKRTDKDNVDIKIDSDNNIIHLEAKVKNEKRYSFIDMVLYISYLNTNVVFNEGNGKYVCSSTTMLEGDLWVTYINLDLNMDECTNDYGEVSVTEINFLNSKNSSKKAELNNSEKDYITFHKHFYTEEVLSETYFLEASNCVHKNIYYYSCKCGAKGNTTFENGEYGEHQFIEKVISEEYYVSDANCEHGTLYYISCFCGEKSEQTFEVGEKQHVATTWKYNNDETFTSCGTKSSKCEHCEYVITEEVEGVGGTPTLIYEDINNITCRIKGVSDYSTRTKIIIPETINGKTVVEASGNGLGNCKLLEELYLPKTIKTITETYNNARSSNSKFNSVYYAGTIIDWLNITVKSSYNYISEYGSVSSSTSSSKDEGIFFTIEKLYLLNGNNEYEELVEYIIPNNITKFNLKFSNINSIKKIIIHSKVSDLEGLGGYLNGVEYAEVDVDNKYFESIDGVIYSKDGKKLVYFPRAYKKTTYEIIDGTEEIEHGFYRPIYLRNLIVPKSLVKGYAYAEALSVYCRGSVIPEGFYTIYSVQTNYKGTLMKEIDLDKLYVYSYDKNIWTYTNKGAVVYNSQYVIKSSTYQYQCIIKISRDHETGNYKVVGLKGAGIDEKHDLKCDYYIFIHCENPDVRFFNNVKVGDQVIIHGDITDCKDSKPSSGCIEFINSNEE